MSCETELKDRMRSQGIDEGLADMIIARIPEADVQASVDAQYAAKERTQASSNLVSALRAFDVGGGDTPKKLGDLASALRGLDVDPTDILKIDKDGNATGIQPRFKSLRATVVSSITKRMAGRADAMMETFISHPSVTRLAEWTADATPEQAKQAVKDVYNFVGKLKEGVSPNYDGMSPAGRMIAEMYVDNAKYLVKNGVDPSVVKGLALPQVPISASKISGMKFADFKGIVDKSGALESVELRKRLATYGYFDENDQLDVERWLKEAYLFHATGRATVPNNPTSVYSFAPDSIRSMGEPR